MPNEAELLVRNLVRYFLRAEERNIYELEASVGNPPLRKPSLEDAYNIHRILTSLCGKISEDSVFKAILTDEESEMLRRILEYGIKEEQREITLLSGSGGNKDFIPNCSNRLELLKAVALARVGAA